MANQQRQIEAVKPRHVSAAPNLPTAQVPAQDSQSRPPVNAVKWGLGCLGVAMLLFTIAAMFGLIVTPVIFRSLKPAQQQELMDRIPWFVSFKPTHAFEALPTMVSDNNAAQALLAPVASPTLAVVLSPTSAAGLISGGASQPANVAQVPSPTPILATNTPVFATAFPTPTGQATATIPPTATAIVPPTDVPLPAKFYLEGVTLVHQGWNGCGPANLTQTLKYYNWTGAKENAEAYLKPNREAKNVSPWQMVNFVNETHPVTDVQALFRVGGDLKLLKLLLSEKFAVIVEKGSYVVDEGWMGHYLTLVGFDDIKHQIIGMDTWLGDGPDHKGRPMDYDEFDTFWQEFNRLFIVVYPVSRVRELSALLGPYADLNSATTLALSKAKLEASLHPDNRYTWFNMGTSYNMLGDYKDAIIAYNKAFSIEGMPFRMLWYQFGPFEANYNVGNFSEVLLLAQTNLQTTPYVTETFYWQGMALAALGDKTKAIASFKSALEVNQNYEPAIKSLADLQNGNFKAPVVALKN